MDPCFLVGCLTGMMGTTKLARDILGSRITSKKKGLRCQRETEAKTILSWYRCCRNRGLKFNNYKLWLKIKRVKIKMIVTERRLLVTGFKIGENYEKNI